MTLKELERLAHLNAKYAEMAYELGKETGRKLDALNMVTRCIADLVSDMTEYGDNEPISDIVKLSLADCLEKQIELIDEIYNK